MNPDELKRRFRGLDSGIKPCRSSRHRGIHEAFYEVAKVIDEILLDSPEKEKAFDRLEEASFWAHQGHRIDRLVPKNDVDEDDVEEVV